MGLVKQVFKYKYFVCVLYVQSVLHLSIEVTYYLKLYSLHLSVHFIAVSATRKAQ